MHGLDGMLLYVDLYAERIPLTSNSNLTSNPLGSGPVSSNTSRSQLKAVFYVLKALAQLVNRHLVNPT